MLINDLYTYKLMSHKDQHIEAILQVNAGSVIFDGHFPELPVTPGVCQVLMIKEVLQEALGFPLQLSSAKYIKFTAVHQPDKSQSMDVQISYSLEEGLILVDGLLIKGQTRYLKFKGEFKGAAG